MKRWTSTLILTAFAVATFAQGNFTITRPAPSSQVREVVNIRIPKSSLSSNSYVGIVINGKFIEAVAASELAGNIKGNEFVYAIDTKKLNLPDGPLSIKAVLYGDFGDSNRVLASSSVNLKLANRDIPMPEGGYRLRYKFNPGTERTYAVEMRSSISSISEAQARLGSRAAELPLEAQRFRYLYAVDNAYSNAFDWASGTYKNLTSREGLIRMQPLPIIGRDYAVLTTAQDPVPKRYFDFQMHPIYMRLNDVGKEIFGRAPVYVPMDGGSGMQNTLDLFAIIPLPTLPQNSLRVGESFPANLQQDVIGNPSDLFISEKLTKPVPARGVLEAVEWEGGRPTARVRMTLSIGSQSADAGVQELEDVYWFAINEGFVVKIERNLTRTLRIRDQVTSGGFGGGGMGGPGGATDGFGGGGAGGASTDFWTRPEAPPADLNQSRPGQRGGRVPGGRGQGGLPGGPPGGMPAGYQGGPGRMGPGGMPGGPGGGFNPGSASGASRVRIVRERTQIVLTLEPPNAARTRATLAQK